ncbi:MAG: manganese efflux pump [Clostridiales bacterium]|nr:manganese efflux pump [Clostridiales bacterium]
MKNFLTVGLTAVIVSLDSFVAGFSVSLNRKVNPTLPSAVALITLLLCLLTGVIGRYLSQYVEQYVNYIAAALLAMLALFNLLKKDENEAARLKSVTLGESLTIGISVGMDAAVANLSLSLDSSGALSIGGVTLLAPIVFGVTHYFTVFLGQVLAQKVALKYSNYFSAAILGALAVSKLI